MRQRLEIRCNAGDAIVANLAVHVVFFFERRLVTGALAGAFAEALTKLPVFAGRMATDGRRMRIRCGGQGVPFTTVSSDRTLCDAIRSTSRDNGLWLVDPVNGATARWGFGPVCKVRVTHLADDATAIGVSFHHAIGDMQTLMIFMNAWAAAAADAPLAEPLIVEDRAAYLDEHLPADGASEPGVRFLGIAEFSRSAVYLAKDARKQRTLSVFFGDDEIARMRDTYGKRMWLSANDVVCAHVSEALMKADPAVDRRTLAIAVNTRNRCGLDPMLVGNIITTLNQDLRRGETASAIAERIRHNVDHFADEYCDMRINQRFSGRGRRLAGRPLCVHCFQSGPVESVHHESERLRPLSPPLRGHRPDLLHAVDENTCRGTRCLGRRGEWPRARLSDVVAAQRIRGHVEPCDPESLTPVSVCRRRHSTTAPSGPRLRSQLVRSTSTVSSRRAWITGYTAAARTSPNTAATPVCSGRPSTPQSILMP